MSTPPTTSLTCRIRRTLRVASAVALIAAASWAIAPQADALPAARAHVQMRAISGPYRWHVRPINLAIILTPGQNQQPPEPPGLTHPNVLAEVNAQRQQLGWPPARSGSNTVANDCVLHSKCYGVQWGGCGLKPRPGDQGLQTVGSAEITDRRGCVEAISYSDWN